MSLSVPRPPVLVSQLPLPDCLVVRAVRAWVIGLKRRIDAAEQIREVLDDTASRKLPV